MSLWDEVMTQNRLDSELIRDKNDISYRITGGLSEKGHEFCMVSLSQLPFLPFLRPTKI